ncbi:pyrimidine/purine nucleoside phosphorylase [Gayadomonas joobiniege]|uniref:pyrimidine/purine nucleoside phosphorylase n=1 Tax=Gayadomonas joobiniege TaxID=1234606 RepID=UPI00035D1578|nr:pyrimidine/purine nucleoside phosphorylase [Gayadomonas joobiniege]
MFDVNSYFDGKVKSIAFEGEQLPTTVGVMAAGDYEFSTSKKEVMTVISGEMTVLLPGETEWQTFTKGQSYEIPANDSFKLTLKSDTAYLCTYE